MRAAMTRRSISEAAEAIDAIDSPTDGLDDGSLSITSQSTGPVTGIFIIVHQCNFALNVRHYKIAFYAFLSF